MNATDDELADLLGVVLSPLPDAATVCFVLLDHITVGRLRKALAARRVTVRRVLADLLRGGLVAPMWVVDVEWALTARPAAGDRS